jgi:hypothetical protein
VSFFNPEEESRISVSTVADADDADDIDSLWIPIFTTGKLGRAANERDICTVSSCVGEEHQPNFMK